jgi:hypothetical protein
VDNTKTKVGNTLAKPVPVDNTKNKVGNPLAKHVPVVLTALLVHPVVHRLVPVDITKMATHARRAPVVVWVNVRQEQCVMVLEPVIPKHVLKTFVLAPMVLQQLEQHVLPMVLILVRLVPVNITKLATPA